MTLKMVVSMFLRNVDAYHTTSGLIPADRNFIQAVMCAVPQAQPTAPCDSLLSIPSNGSREIDNRHGLALSFGNSTHLMRWRRRSLIRNILQQITFFPEKNRYTINKSRERPRGETCKRNTINNRSNSTLKNNQSTISIITKPIFNFPLRNMQ